MEGLQKALLILVDLFERSTGMHVVCTGLVAENTLAVDYIN